MNKIIDTSKDCIVKTFMKCMFDKCFDDLVISGEFTEDEKKSAWKSIYTEFIDLSGMIESREFDLLKTIFYLDCRVKKINLLLYIQRVSIEKIGVPCIGAFDNIRMYGHRLIWDKEHPDLQTFLKRLTDIETKEKRYQMELELKTKEFFELKKIQASGDIPIQQKRKDFIRSINNLQKYGYVIDYEKTTVEALGIMISDYNDTLQKEYSTKKS